MKKQDLATRLARKTRVSRAAAADRLDHIIHDILAELKKGNPVSLPGLGTLTPGKKLNFLSDNQQRKDKPRRDKKR
jgi:nucleoid DNA-binding protein